MPTFIESKDPLERGPDRRIKFQGQSFKESDLRKFEVGSFGFLNTEEKLVGFVNDLIRQQDALDEIDFQFLRFDDPRVQKRFAEGFLGHGSGERETQRRAALLAGAQEQERLGETGAVETFLTNNPPKNVTEITEEQSATNLGPLGLGFNFPFRVAKILDAKRAGLPPALRPLATRATSRSRRSARGQPSDDSTLIGSSGRVGTALF